MPEILHVLATKITTSDALELLRKNCTVVDNLDRPDEVEAIIVIGKHGVGCNTIDLTEAKKRGITVLNTPGANANSVAELIVGLMLDISRNITLAHNKTQHGAFKKIAPAEMTGMELTGKTLGLIGYDPYVSREVMAKFGYEKYETVQELIANSSSELASTPQGTSSTKMIYTLPSRPESSEQQRVVAQHFVNEPPTSANTKLFELDNFIGTPHIGACAEESLYRMGMEVVQEVLNVLCGKEPAHRVA